MTSAPASLTRAQVREVDRISIEEYGIPGIVLMENAGLLAALAIVPLMEGRRASPVGIFCGGGNNGGDGYVVGRQLANRGFNVRLYSTKQAHELSGDAATNRRIVDAMGLDVRSIATPEEVAAVRGEWSEAALLVDALLGTGFEGDVRPPVSDAIAALEDAREEGVSAIVALDVPSGLDCDHGTPSNATVQADLTLTFVARKRGFERPGSQAYTGVVRVLPIGAPQEAVALALERA